MGERDREHLVGRRHLEVERKGDAPHQSVDVGVGDVPPVFAQVRRDAVGPRPLGGLGGAQRIGMLSPASIPDRRDMVDVDPEAEAAGHAARLPGLTPAITASSAGRSSAG